MKKISIASLLCAAVMCFSCGEAPNEETTINNVTLSSDRNVIKCDGIDASTLVLVDDEGKVVTDGIEFYDNNMNAVTLKNGKFTADEAGEYTIWAAYKTFNSNQITIKAINADIPAPAADPKPA
jgi:major membrane immunogen (membrane-anchored lipoprotein)